MGFLSDSDRDRLIVAVAGLCAERGYEEIEDDEIAARAGLAAGATVAIFGGKEECVKAAENAILLEVVSVVSRSYSADRSEWDNVVLGVRALLELMAQQPTFAYLGYVVSRQMAPDAVLEINRTGHRMIEAMLERGWEYSRSGPQPPRVALGILGGAQAIIRREVTAGRAAELPRLLPDCTYIATVPFLGQREALRLARESAELLQGTRWA